MAGIYIHIPFCKQKCSYCDFHFSTTFGPYREQMIDAMLKEMELQQSYFDDTIQTIYFGGGTPSLLLPSELEDLLAAINRFFNIAPNAEITLEANPDDMNADNLIAWKKAGVNRLSIGLQSFQQNELDWMNRAHNVQQALECVKNAQQLGFENISIDLIYGLPHLDEKIWQQTLQQAIDLKVQHISAYCLTVEPKTALHRMVKNKKMIPANEDDQSGQFEMLVNTLKEAGFEQYEISNFGLKGFRSQHNSNYWKSINYLGIGPSAHSFDGSSRQWNVAHNRLYIQKLQADIPWFEKETLTPVIRFNELLLTGLRTSDGVNIAQLSDICEPSLTFWKLIRNFEKNQWLIIENDQIVLTQKGKLMADYICSELFLERE